MGVVHTPTYRERYAEFLKLDFPRIPFPRSREIFSRVAEVGKALIQLHLLEFEASPVAKFEGEGDGVVGKGRKAGVRYDEENLRVYINKTQFFAPVPKEIWEYQIGGYQVAEKWLKDRKGRKLSLEDIETYLKTLTALAQTMTLQKQLDEIYPEVEREALAIQWSQNRSNSVG